MTSGGNNFNDFLENQLTRQIGTTRSFVQSKIFQQISFAYFDSRPLMSMTAGDRRKHISVDSVF